MQRTTKTAATKPRVPGPLTPSPGAFVAQSEGETMATAFKARSLGGANSIIAELEQRLECKVVRESEIVERLDTARCLASERAGAIHALTERAAKWEGIAKQQQAVLDKFETLLGCKPDYDNLVLIAEIIEQSIHVRDHWQKLGACRQTFSKLDKLADLVGEKEDGREDGREGGKP